MPSSYIYAANQTVRHVVPHGEAWSVLRMEGLTNVTINGTAFNPLGGINGPPDYQAPPFLPPGTVIEATAGPDGGAMFLAQDGPHALSVPRCLARRGVYQSKTIGPGKRRVTWTVPDVGPGNDYNSPALYLWGRNTAVPTVTLTNAGYDIPLTLVGRLKDAGGRAVLVFRETGYEGDMLSYFAPGETLTLTVDGESEYSDLDEITPVGMVNLSVEVDVGGGWGPGTEVPAFQVDSFLLGGRIPNEAFTVSDLPRPQDWPPGVAFWDPTLGKPLWKKPGNIWVDSSGTAV